MTTKFTILASAVTLALMSFQSVSIAALQDDLIVWDSSDVPSVTKNTFNFSAAEATSDVRILEVKNGASGKLANLDLSVNALGKQKDEGDRQVIALYLSGGNVDFSGDKLAVKLTTDFSGGGNNQASAFLIYGGESTISSTVTDLSVESKDKNGKSVYGIGLASSKLNLTGKEVNINLVSATEREGEQYSEALGIDLYNDAIIETSENTSVNISVKTSSTLQTVEHVSGEKYPGTFVGATPASGIKFEGGSGKFNGDVNIDVQSVGGLASAVTVSNFFNNSSYGETWGNSTAEFNNLNASASTQSGEASGVVISYTKGGQVDNNVILKVTGTTNIVAKSEEGLAYGIKVDGNTSTNLEGNTTISASAGTNGQAYAAFIEEGKVVFSGKENSFYGDVLAQSGASLSFNNGSSYIDGNVTAKEATVLLDKATLDLAENSTINAENLTSNDGTVVLNSVDEKNPAIKIATLSGRSLDVVASSELGNQFASEEEAAKAMKANVAVDNNLGTNLLLSGEESDVLGAWSVDKDGTLSKQSNTKLLSMKGVNAAALVAWRDEVAYTNQRMEFLRDNSHAYGAWAQVYGGESSYDDASVDLKTTTVQVGADMAIGDWVAGAAFSYMNGDADMSNGQADTDAYTLSLYANRTFDSGLFVNALARYGRLSTDATAGNMDGSYDNNAFSIGANVGYRFTFAEQGFVEPMFGLQYAYVTGDDYKASNGVKVEQDDFDALIASLGARVGFDYAKNAGKLYARASVNYDFLGEVDGTAGNGKAVQDMYVDLGGTWFTYGVGTQFNITDNLSVWGNVDRTSGGDVSTHYMMNAGLRYVF